MTESIRIERAAPQDIPLILKFIRELAQYERMSQECVATEDLLRKALFGEKKFAEAVIAYYQDKPAGFEVFFHNFSTFLARPGIYLEDLYVSPHLRGKGIGKALLLYLAQLAKERNCGRLEWAVLDWNEPSINFYKKLGAIPLNDWTTFRLTGNALDMFAKNFTTKTSPQ
ncbi:MAG: GNAT family N-acetyltransferase [Bacteroidota bacterium]